MMPIVRAESTVNSNAFKHIMDRISNRSLNQTENITLNLSGEAVQEIIANNNMIRTSELKRAMTPTSTHLMQPLATMLGTG